MGLKLFKGQVLQVDNGHSCETHPDEDLHPATHLFDCGCGDYFYFCRRDGEAALRILNHRCQPTHIVAA